MSMLGFKKKAVEVRIVRRNRTACLLAAFNASSPPRIWQYDLDKLAAFTITLKARDGAWDLGLLGPDGVFAVVATFDERPEADVAYFAVQKALVENATEGWKVGLHWVVGLIVALFLIAAGSNVLKHVLVGSFNADGTAQTEDGGYAGGQGASVPYQPGPPPKPKELELGVPMNADDVLSVPQD